MTGSGNVILIGMPGSGKSTAGLLLARSICHDFIDTDMLIQKRERKTLQQIINNRGIQYFLELEEKILLEQNDFDRPIVMATGGSAVLSDKAMRHLHKLGRVVWLDVPVFELKRRLKNIHSRGVAMSAEQTIDDLLAARLPLYKYYADVTIDTTGRNLEQTVEQLITELELDRCDS